MRLRVAVWLAEGIEWVLRHHRLARLLYAAAEFNGRISARLLRGEGRECPCCGGHFKRMSRRRVAGFGGICPRCRSHPRHRAIALLLARGDLPGRRLLHFAPEPSSIRSSPGCPRSSEPPPTSTRPRTFSSTSRGWTCWTARST